MKRRNLLTNGGGCLLASVLSVSGVLKTQKAVAQIDEKKYSIEIEIYESTRRYCKLGGHFKGQKLEYPKDWDRICPYLKGSLSVFIEQLADGQTLPWTYAGTPYEKVINQDGITTEYVRCPDPSEKYVVAKIIRTQIRQDSQ